MMVVTVNVLTVGAGVALEGSYGWVTESTDDDTDVAVTPAADANAESYDAEDADTVTDEAVVTSVTTI